jgi:hypothetical protein
MRYKSHAMNYLRNRPFLISVQLADRAKGSAGRGRSFGSGTNTEKDRDSGHWRYNFVSGKTKIPIY